MAAGGLSTTAARAGPTGSEGISTLPPWARTSKQRADTSTIMNLEQNSTFSSQTSSGRKGADLNSGPVSMRHVSSEGDHLVGQRLAERLQVEGTSVMNGSTISHTRLGAFGSSKGSGNGTSRLAAAGGGVARLHGGDRRPAVCKPGSWM